MRQSVSLADALAAIESYDDVEQVGLYLDRETGRTFWITSDFEVEPTDLCEVGDADRFADSVYDSRNDADSETFAEFDEVTSNPTRYLQLPSANDVNKIERAEVFAQRHIVDAEFQKKVLKAIKKANRQGWNDSAEIYRLICEANLVCEWNAFNDVLNEEFLHTWGEAHDVVFA